MADHRILAIVLIIVGFFLHFIGDIILLKSTDVSSSRGWIIALYLAGTITIIVGVILAVLGGRDKTAEPSTKK